MDTPPMKQPIVGSKNISRRNLRKPLSDAITGAATGGGLGYVLSKRGFKGGRIGAALGAIGGLIKPTEMAGIVVARALVRAGATIEFGSQNPFDRYHDTDYSDLNSVLGKNFATRQNAYGGKTPVGFVLSQAEKGHKMAGDIVDAVRNRSLDSKVSNRPQAQAGNFQITHESAHTARITTAPHTRERRKKYEWERTGFQRKAAVLGAGVATVAGAGVMAALTKHSPRGLTEGVVSGLAKGGHNMAARATYGVKRRVARAVGANMRSPFKMPHVGPNNSMMAKEDQVKAAAQGFTVQTPKASNIVNSGIKQKKKRGAGGGQPPASPTP
jgi:hypothetical protein